jgi:chromosome segregation ATPase
MRLDDLPAKFSDFLDQAQEVLRFEVDRGRKTRDALKAENATLKTENVSLRDQQEAAQKQLSAALSHLQRASTLADIEHNTAEAKKTLDGLRGDIAEATTALAGMRAQCKDAENQRDAAITETAGVRQAAVVAVAERDRIMAMFDVRGAA